jgi:hypothetical protein
MKVLAVLRAIISELVSLVVDDAVTFVGGLVGLVLMYVLAHEVRSLRAVSGFVAFAVVWAALAVSLVRAVRAARD